MQMLWDRSEMDGYANHITSDPLEDTPIHQVLLDEAFGDHQVANIAAENEARTIGAEVHQPGTGAGTLARRRAVLGHPSADPGRLPRLGPVHVGQRLAGAAHVQRAARARATIPTGCRGRSPSSASRPPPS